MSYRISFEIATLPQMNSASGHSRGRHWTAAHRFRDQWRALVAYAVGRAGGSPPAPLRLAAITATRFSSRQPDYGNLVESFKGVIDSLLPSPRGCGVLLDDSPRVLPYDRQMYRWQKAPLGQGKIALVIEEID